MKLSLLLLASSLVVACGGGVATGQSSSPGDPPAPDQCVDCGPCGMAGPVEPGSFYINSVGTDAKGSPAVGLWVEKGKCQAESRAMYALTVDPELTRFSLEERQDLTLVSSVLQDQNRTYTWSSPPVELRIDLYTQGLTRFVFTNAKRTMTLECASKDLVLSCQQG